MASKDQEAQKPVEVGDPVAAEARREVRAKFHRRPDDGYFGLACTLARAAAEAAANDDAGLLGGTL